MAQGHGRRHAKERPKERRPDTGSLASLSAPFLWPLLAAAQASEMTASLFKGVASAWPKHLGSEEGRAAVPEWATANRVALELPSMRLRDFSKHARGQATLICAPYALHGATVADFAEGHSVVRALRRSGVSQVHVTEWRSATPEMRYFSIDSYLADLNVAVDQVGAPADIIGLCQGGWLALVYAARFPEKVRRLALVGAPIDIRAEESPMSRMTGDTPIGAFEALVNLGGGRVLGQQMLNLWSPPLKPTEAAHTLELSPDTERGRATELKKRFLAWYGVTLDLPGTYYLQVIRCLFKENQIAEGRFVALGRAVDLAKLRVPLFLLAARDDEVVAPGQLLSVARLVGTAKDRIETTVEPCKHLSLFVGARALTGAWSRVAHWFARS